MIILDDFPLRETTPNQRACLFFTITNQWGLVVIYKAVSPLSLSLTAQRGGPRVVLVLIIC